jgi:autotransporter-associated beta strand protein
MFSNNASAFVVGGNALNLGDSITDDSAAAQIINVSMDFAFGLFHFPTNRTINVNSAAGSLILNGNIAGDTNAYFNSYSITKQGPGLLMFNGINTFIASLFLNGGLVKFNTLNTNLAGSLGTGTSISINGGGLQWAAGNTADISVRTVTISTNGATFDVGGNTVTLTNRIGNGGVGSLTKLGSGTLIFNATNNYKGDTLIAQGTLALGLNGLLTNSPQIILSNNATLDVSARSDGMQTLLVGKSLVGNGTIRGSVIAASGSTIAPGFSIGTLVITNALTFQSGSTNIMELNKSMSSCDLITGMVSVTYGGRLIVTNINGSFSNGDSFKLFNAASYIGSFSSLTLPALSGSLIWVNKLAIDGTIAVSLPVNTTPTNLVTTVVGNGLQINWPADHTGWQLEAQTNAANTGLGTNWTIVTGSGATNQMLFPLDLVNGSVFFRLVYP